MKKNKKLYILLSILVGMCIITLIATNIEKKSEEIKNSGESILEIDIDTVKGLSWNIADEERSLAFHKDDNWIYDEDTNFPVDKEKIEDALSIFESFAADFIIENVENFEQYGLVNPQADISIETDDKTYEINIGDYSKMDSERYVSIGDGNVYLMKEDPMDTFDKELKDFIKDDEIPDFEGVASIKFEGEVNSDIVLNEKGTNPYNEEDVYFETYNEKFIPLDTDNIDKYLGKIENLDLNKYVTYNVTDDELDKYGINSPDLLININYNEMDEDENSIAKEFNLTVGSNIEELEEDPDEEDILGYIRINESKIIYEIPGYDYNALIEDAGDELRHKNIIPADTKDISSIDVLMDNNKYHIVNDKKGEDVRFIYNDKEIENFDFEESLTLLNATSFTEDKPTGEKELSLLVSVDSNASPQITIDIYRYDGESCLVTVDGNSLAYINRDNVIDLKEAVNGFVLAQDIDE